MVNKSLLTAFALGMALCASAATSEPVAPGNLKADVNGVIVNLNWEWGNAGKVLVSHDFDNDEFPPEGVELKNTYSDAEGNWLTYSFAEDEEPNLTHSGSTVAMLMMGGSDISDPNNHQDEWMIFHPGAGAVYMDFWYYIYPMLLEDGAYQDFPDHYYVKISRDGGNSWTELWDARWDMGAVDAVQQASLFLGEPADENTLVAFQGLSAEDQGLYYLWAVDDVSFTAADGTATSPQLRTDVRPAPERLSASLAGMATHRTFTPADSARVRKAPASEWLNAGNTTYRVYLDEEIVSDYLKARHFTEYSNKSAGKHTYRVVAWSEAKDKEYDSSSVTVDIDEMHFAPARNLKVSAKETASGSYEIEGTWEDAQGDMKPDYYEVKINGKNFGRVDYGEEYAVGQSGLFKGVYTFSVAAVYTFPDGTSEPLSVIVSPGTVMPPAQLKVEQDGTSNRLTWTTPVADPAPVKYDVYRGDKLLQSGLTATEYNDAEVPADSFFYNVHAVYTDGTVSLPASVAAPQAAAPYTSLPLLQNFDNGHLPVGWSLQLVDSNNSVKDMYNWRFDNWFGFNVPDGTGLIGGFASVNAPAAGMNRLECNLITPMLAVGDDCKVTFTKYFTEEKPGPSGPAQFVLQKSTDGGEYWEDVADLVTADNGTLQYVIPDAGKRVKLRWSFLGRNSGFAAIDNVVITDAGTGSVSGVTSDPHIASVFTPQGILVTADAEAFRALPSGIYIVRLTDGTTRKILVK